MPTNISDISFLEIVFGHLLLVALLWGWKVTLSKKHLDCSLLWIGIGIRLIPATEQQNVIFVVGQ